MEYPIKRVSIMIGERQHKTITDRGLNLSGFIRELIDDHFCAHKITLSVGERTYRLYKQLVSKGDDFSSEIEPYILDGLRAVLKSKMKKMVDLEKMLERETKNIQ